MQSFRLDTSGKLSLAPLAIGLALPLAVASFLIAYRHEHRGALYLFVLLMGVIALGLVAKVAKVATATRQARLAKTLVPSWSGRWDAAILDKYVELREQRAYARLVASRRWAFTAIPSVCRTGITIELKGRGVTDDDLAALSAVRTLHVLVLADCPITDAGLSRLPQLPSLECLVLSRTRVTDACLVCLKGLPELRTVDMDGTAIHDSALRAAGLLDKKFSLAPVERKARSDRSAAPRGTVPQSLELVEINRRLAAMRPDACLPDLAVSLNNLGWGKRDEYAVSALRESVAIHRRLTASGMGDHRPALSTSLANLGRVLEEMGRCEDALAATQEAVDVYREIAHTLPEPGTELALNLHRLGNLFSKLRRRDEAVQAMRESVAMYRQRVAASPDALMLHSWFVSSLLDLCSILNALDRNEEALAAAEEAVEVSQNLSGNWPGSSNLAASLNHLGKTLSALGRHDEALAATRASADLPRPKSTG